VAYDPNVLAQALAAARRFGATKRETKALIEAGIVESGLRNLPHGDRDSVGFLQQRPSQGWRGLTDVPAAAAEFLQHARDVTRSGFKGSSGELAQSVQRSAFPARYDQAGRQAESLLQGGGYTGASSGAGGSVTLSTGGDSSAPADTGGGIDAAVALLQAAGQQKPVIQSAGLQAPSFSARPVMPQGAQLPQSGGGPASSGPGLDQLLTLVASSQGQGATPSQSQGSVSTTVPLGGQTPGGSTSGARGQVKITGADPGRIATGTLAFARKIAGVYGAPLVGDSGASHSLYTTSGNISEHSTGHAIDFPATGQKLIRMGQAALIAAGMPPAEARKKTGGLFNVTSPNGVRHQIIFNTHIGGDHTNHLHASAARRAA
jgi:hypothetical protein